jgi:hypothetical protein
MMGSRGALVGKVEVEGRLPLERRVAVGHVLQRQAVKSHVGPPRLVQLDESLGHLCSRRCGRGESVLKAWATSAAGGAGGGGERAESLSNLCSRRCRRGGEGVLDATGCAEIPVAGDEQTPLPAPAG